MAQESWKMDSNEMGCQPPPEGLTLCSNNCGFFGSSTTMNLCSQCYRDALLKQAKVAEMAAAISAVRSQPPAEKGANQHKDIGTEAAAAGSSQSEVADSSSGGTLLEQPSRKVNRCLSCNKRVGVTGFKCRCGGLFCSLHRYNDKHDCSFDYKAAAQSLIRKANPVVKADKMDTI